MTFYIIILGFSSNLAFISSLSLSDPFTSLGRPAIILMHTVDLAAAGRWRSGEGPQHECATAGCVGDTG